MAKGRFEGLTDAQWLMIEPLLPADPKKRGKGHPHTPWRLVCNTILWVLITGSRDGAMFLRANSGVPVLSRTDGWGDGRKRAYWTSYCKRCLKQQILVVC